jgi:hypothetical protein
MPCYLSRLLVKGACTQQQTTELVLAVCFCKLVYEFQQHAFLVRLKGGGGLPHTAVDWPDDVGEADDSPVISAYLIVPLWWVQDQYEGVASVCLV